MRGDTRAKILTLLQSTLKAVKTNFSGLDIRNLEISRKTFWTVFRKNHVFKGISQRESKYIRHAVVRESHELPSQLTQDAAIVASKAEMWVQPKNRCIKFKPA